MTKKQRGGPRGGAGAKPLYKAPMSRYNVMLDPETVARLTKLGNGNLSAGIRLAALLAE